jgi:hypothetical protein
MYPPDSSSLFLVGFIYVVSKSLLEICLADIWNMLRKLSRLIYTIRIVRYDDFGLEHSEFMEVARWLGGDLWTESGLDFMTRKTSVMRTMYFRDGSPFLFGPLLDNGLEEAKRSHMFGFGLFIFGRDNTWTIRKSVDGWPVWFVFDGIHSFIADHYKVLHQNSARFGSHKPVVAVITLSFTPTHVLSKLAVRLKIQRSEQLRTTHLSFQNYHAIIRTESKLAELEWSEKALGSRDLVWPNPKVQSAVDLVEQTLLCRNRSTISRLNILLYGSYGTGKTKLVQWLAARTGSHLVVITKESKWSAVLDAIYNTARGPKILLFDEVDTMFEQDTVIHSAQPCASPTIHMTQGHGDSSNAKNGGSESKSSEKSFLCNGGSMNFRKTCAGFVYEDEEMVLKESISQSPSVLLHEHHILSLLDGSAFSSYPFPIVCFMCTNFPDKIPDRVTRWGRITIKLEMTCHTLESALNHSRHHHDKIRELFSRNERVTPGQLQSLIDTGFVGM